MMNTTELLKKVRQIEYKTKGLSNHLFSGAYHSAFKGRGMSFSEVREYQYGDDVKNIDWNVTARFKTPFVKVFEEERELTLMLLVDISGSSLFGTQQLNKRSLITEICAVLAFSANTNNDKVGVIFFSDKVEFYIPPKKGSSHILRIIRELIAREPKEQSQTDIGEALQFLNTTLKKKTICFLISDLISKPFDKQLQITARKHDLIGIHISDPLDSEMPNLGLIDYVDAESGKTISIDTSHANVRNDYHKAFVANQQYAQKSFRKQSATLLSIPTQADYIKILQGFFKNR
ncbi:MAG: hypothetical protein RIQ61_1030 [Bacteroidota bacterium]